ncbi:hypothetical protein MJH12_10380 [bacterium]|nr:hypothetical protein [bacterium]
MNYLHKIISWDGKYHCEYRQEPIMSPKGSLLSFSNRAIIVQLLENEEISTSYDYRFLSDLADEQFETFDTIWSYHTFKTLCKLNSVELSLNIPNYADFLRTHHILLINEDNVSQQFRKCFENVFATFSISQKVLLSHFYKIGFELSSCILYVADIMDLEELIDSIAYIEWQRLGKNKNSFKKSLSSEMKSLIQFKYLLQ